jgi:hypothetical protein
VRVRRRRRTEPIVCSHGGWCPAWESRVGWRCLDSPTPSAWAPRGSSTHARHSHLSGLGSDPRAGREPVAPSAGGKRSGRLPEGMARERRATPQGSHEPANQRDRPDSPRSERRGREPGSWDPSRQRMRNNDAGDFMSPRTTWLIGQ